MAASNRLEFLFLNLGHFYDHLFILIYATVAALVLPVVFEMSYSELIIYATPGFMPSAPLPCRRGGSRIAGVGGA